jgi:hypothetical protein
MFSNFTAFLPLLQLVSFSFAAKQQVLKDGTGPFTSKFGQLANDTLRLFNVPGVSIAVVDGDNVWAEVDEDPLTPPSASSVNIPHN